VKLLLDQNLSRKLVPELQARYPGSTHVYLLRLHTADDSYLWYYARQHGFTLATKNTDMVDLCVFRGAPPKVLWVRTGNCSTAEISELFARNERRIAEFERDETRVVLSLFRFTAIE
jgi:predicted nuclease of predicted toxin-antitoxin system